MTVQEFDFREPPPGSLEARVTTWLQETCAQSIHKWTRFLSFGAEWVNPKVESLPTTRTLARCSEAAVGFRIEVADHPQLPPLLVIERPLVLALLAGALGESVKAIPPDREFTAVESTMCDFLVQNLFLDLFSDSWPLGESLDLSIGERGLPSAVNRLPANDLQLVVTITLKTSFAEPTFQLLLPRSGFVDGLMESVGGDVIDATPTPPEEIAGLVREMPIDLAVVLGSAEVTFLQLATLQRGDLIILEQKVTEPLAARVGGLDKFAVWPGAVGKRQAVQIAQTMEAKPDQT